MLTEQAHKDEVKVQGSNKNGKGSGIFDKSYIKIGFCHGYLHVVVRQRLESE